MKCESCGFLKPGEIPLHAWDNTLRCPRWNCDGVVASGIAERSNPSMAALVVLPANELLRELDDLDDPDFRWFSVPRGAMSLPSKNGQGDVMSRPYAMEISEVWSSIRESASRAGRESVDFVKSEIFNTSRGKPTSLGRITRQIEKDLELARPKARKLVSMATEELKGEGKIVVRSRPGGDAVAFRNGD